MNSVAKLLQPSMSIRLLVRLIALSALPAAVSAQGAPDSARARLRQELRARADSLERLDPARELAAALRRGDRRFIGVQGYVRVAPGLALGDPLYPKQDAMHVIEGTSDAIWAPEVERLNRVSAAYAERYNRLLHEHLRREPHERSRPAT